MADCDSKDRRMSKTRFDNRIEDERGPGIIELKQQYLSVTNDVISLYEISKNGRTIGSGSWEGHTIRTLEIAPSMRLKGYGTQLLKKIEEDMIERGECNEIFVLAYPNSSYGRLGVSVEDIRSFYAKNGYEPFDDSGTFLMNIVRKFFPSFGHESNWMHKKIKHD